MKNTAGRLVPLFFKNCIRIVTLLLAVSILSFALVSVSPIDPVQQYIMGIGPVSEAQRAEIAAYWGADKPVAARYVSWLCALLRGDFGLSLLYVMGTYRDHWQDKLLRRLCCLLSSMPAFWLGLVLLLVFSVKLGWFPIGFSTPIGMLDSEVSVWQRLHHLALPALTLSLMSFSNIALHTRQKMIDVMNSPYILFARARGESGWTLFVRHGLRNTILPALTLQFASFAELFGGSVLAENVFSYPGLGSAVSAAGLNSDVPLLLGITLFSTLFVCVGNMIANLLYGVIDPKMRNGEE